jgi:hypothetical protein
MVVSLCCVSDSWLKFVARCGGRGLGGDDRQKFVPGFHERLRAIVPESDGQTANIDLGAGNVT